MDYAAMTTSALLDLWTHGKQSRYEDALIEDELDRRVDEGDWDALIF